MKLINLIIVLLILFVIFSSVTEGFILTNNIPSGLSITLSKGAQPITATVGTGFTTDGVTLDANTYYAVGNLNDAGKKAVNDANALVKNNGTACNQFPSNLYIKLPATDSVCKTADVDLYDVPADSNTVCTILENGVWKKQGKLKTDASITITAKFGNGKTCTQQLPATKNINCGPINAICPVNDNTFYTFNPAITKGNALIVPTAPTIVSIASSLSTEYWPGRFTATIKVTPPASYATLGITNYSVSIIDKTTNQKVNVEDTVTIDSSGNLKVNVDHQRDVDESNYNYYGNNWAAMRSAMAYAQYDFDGSYNVTIAGINTAGIVGVRSAVFSFNSGYPSSEAMARVTSEWTYE